ncbi:MAG: fused response regulator/phosphatase [Planctomycetota bacterium]|nr:fused response regulator/phosphatase [Planctomycetota bacterium]
MTSTQKTILTIDDEPLIRELIRSMFSCNGFHVLEAGSGMQGIEIVQHQHVDVIILDLAMPEMDGWEVVRRLKSNPKTRPIPVLILTASVTDSTVVRGLDAGADDYCQKGVSTAELVARARALIRTRELQDELVRMVRQRHEEQLAFARDIQARLLPRDHPEQEGIEYYIHYEPCEAIGGDFYDHFPMGDGRTCMIMGDAEGHGLSAALLMATVRAYIRASLTEEFTPAQLLAGINNLVSRDPGYSGFLPMVCFIFDSANQRLTFANAGHERPMLIHNDGTVISLDVTGPIIGIQEGMAFEEEEVALTNDDTLLYFTDALIEGINHDGEPFGRERIEAIVAISDGASLNSIAARLITDWKTHIESVPEDDVTLILARLV